MRDAGDLRTRAETLAAPLPPLLASAQHLAASVIVGDHGRRRAGNGDTFWQYRPAQHHDSARQIDWRRSARSDSRFVQDKEWQIAQSIGFWVDQSARMTFASAGHPPKGDRARLIALALAIVLARGGERIGLTDARLPPRSDPRQIQLMAQILCQSDPAASLDDAPPDASGLLAQSRAVFISDFLGDLDAVTRSVTMAADRGVAGALVQVLDPAERDFPFDGRCVFQSMSGTIAHETQKAGDLRARYLERLAARQDALAHLARTTGWQYYADDTGRPATPALLWLYAAMDRHA
jgi:uncharacterized protein (DUF58 family)